MSAVVPSCIDVFEYIRIFFKLQKTHNDMEKRFVQMVKYVKETHPEIYNLVELHSVKAQCVNGVISRFDAGVDASTIPGRQASPGERHEAWREETLDTGNELSVTAGKLRNDCAATPHHHKRTKQFVPVPPPTRMEDCLKTLCILLFL